MTKYNTHTLGNGLRIIHLPSPSQVVYCGYQIAVGSRHERLSHQGGPDGEEGLAHYCEHMAFKGTERRNALQIINALEGVGGDLNAFTNKEDTTYYAAISKEHFAKAVEVLTDIVFHSQYPQHEMDKEVEVICDEIESYNDSPAELIYDEFENILFAGHPLGHNILGSAERLHAYKSGDLQRFVSRHYYPGNAVFFVYGDVNFGRLVRVLESRTEGIGSPEDHNPHKGSDPHVTHPSQQGLTPCERDPIIRNIGSHQAHVMTGTLAYRHEDPRRLTLYLLNNILGGPGMNSRLNLALRERHGLVYTVESMMAAYSDCGLWGIYFGCDHHDTDRCLRIVSHELERIAGQTLSDRQLTAAKRQLKGQIAIACDNREQFALDFGRSCLHHGGGRDLDHLYARIDAITAGDIKQVASDLFGGRKLTTLIFK